MMSNHYKYVYFLGIGGIGMSALARFFLKRNIRVGGYDRTASSITRQLESEGAEIIYTDDPVLIPDVYKSAAKEELLVIYTPAVPVDLSLLLFFNKSEMRPQKRAEVLGMISKDMFTLAVAGTHGKTTTSTLLSHILLHCGYSLTAFLGGISGNYQTNYIDYSEGVDFPFTGNRKLMVVEADEYDRSFLQLNPYGSILTSADADHLDIYNTSDSVTDSYREYLNCVNVNGPLLLKKGLELKFSPPNQSRVFTYSIDVDADYVATDIHLDGVSQVFSCAFKGASLGEFRLSMPGRHNVENALAVIGMCHSLGLSVDSFSEGFRHFKGVRRRFEICYDANGKVLIDDYAHHPEEIRAAVSSARMMFPGRRITGIFQPHLFSRTRDFIDEFVKSLDLLDRLLLMEIYPARELPIDGVSSDMISSRLRHASCRRVVHADFKDISAEFEQCDVMLVMGAGDVEAVVPDIINSLINA